MSVDRPATDCLCAKLHAAIDYCRREWKVTYAEVIGSLEVVKFDILEEMTEPEENEESNSN